MEAKLAQKCKSGLLENPFPLLFEKTKISVYYFPTSVKLLYQYFLHFRQHLFLKGFQLTVQQILATMKS